MVRGVGELGNYIAKLRKGVSQGDGALTFTDLDCELEGHGIGTRRKR